jgi:spore coat polysaccharide biosynthesis protein SpsF
VDDPLAAYGLEAGIAVFRGATENVAQRCADCAREYAADYFVRLNGDSPFLDPLLIETGLQAVADNSRIDLVTNLVGRTFPYGVSVEVVNAATLRDVLQTLQADEVEHVTKRFYEHASDFTLHTMYSPKPQLHGARMVVDTLADLRVFSRVVQRLGGRVLQANYDEVASLYLAD